MILYEDNFFLVAEQAPLNEGFWSQWFTGHDDEKLIEMRGALAQHIKTEHDRQKALEKIDDAIDNATRVWQTGSNPQHFLADVGLSFLTGPFSIIIKGIVRLSTSDQRKAFRESLHKIRAEIVALKLKG